MMFGLEYVIICMFDCFVVVILMICLFLLILFVFFLIIFLFCFVKIFISSSLSSSSIFFFDVFLFVGFGIYVWSLKCLVGVKFIFFFFIDFVVVCFSVDGGGFFSVDCSAFVGDCRRICIFVGGVIFFVFLIVFVFKIFKRYICVLLL